VVLYNSLDDDFDVHRKVYFFMMILIYFLWNNHGFDLNSLNLLCGMDNHVVKWWNFNWV